MIDLILSRLAGVRPISGGFIAKCPAHEDRKPSLTVRDTGDKILMNCHAGCETLAVVEAIGLEWSDLFAEDQVRSRGLNAAQRRSIGRSLLYDATYLQQADREPVRARESLDRLDAARKRYGDHEFRRILDTLDGDFLEAR